MCIATALNACFSRFFFLSQIYALHWCKGEGKSELHDEKVVSASQDGKLIVCATNSDSGYVVVVAVVYISINDVLCWCWIVGLERSDRQ